MGQNRQDRTSRKDDRYLLLSASSVGLWSVEVENATVVCVDVVGSDTRNSGVRRTSVLTGRCEVRKQIKERFCCRCGEKIRTTAVTVVRGKVWMCTHCAGEELNSLAVTFEKTTPYQIAKFFGGEAEAKS